MDTEADADSLEEDYDMDEGNTFRDGDIEIASRIADGVSNG